MSTAGSTGRPGRPGRAGRQPPQLAPAQAARGALQEQFYRVDQFQSDIGGTVAQYADLLPERSRTSGVVPGWRVLDQRATEQIVAYLGLLDRFDPLEEQPASVLQQAIPAFGDVTSGLGYLGNDMEHFLERFGDELRRVGEAKQQVGTRIAVASAAVDRAEAAWRRMTADGFQFDAADRALAQARVAARKLVEAQDKLAPGQVDEPVALVEQLAAEALALATDLPRRAASLRTRIPSLATRIDALENRSGSVPDAMRSLRREFSARNWEDLAAREQDVTALISSSRGQVAQLRRLQAQEDLGPAVAALGELEQLLADADRMVDGPHARLVLLRSVRDNPTRLLDEARFKLRDARYLVLGGRPVVQPPWAGRLDAAAAELIALEGALEGNHPDYWAFHLRTEALQERIRSLVADFRAAH